MWGVVWGSERGEQYGLFLSLLGGGLEVGLEVVWVSQFCLSGLRIITPGSPLISARCTKKQGLQEKHG